MKIYPDTKIYVHGPAQIASGGPELTHQLASQLLKLSLDACMFYNSDLLDPVHPRYKKYHVPFARTVEDEPHNVLIIPESANNLVYRYKNIQRVFWWLSVDNYVGNVQDILNSFKASDFLKPRPQFFYFNAAIDESLEHRVQSEYARQFCLVNGVSESRIKVVRDYINSEFIRRAAYINLADKQDIVAFYPYKGFEFTQKLIKAAPEINWAPIHHMTPDQVQNLLAHSKVYIDFGHHPGRDRIPREAAISGCVVITGRRGAANNPIDIAIDDSFKFDDRDENIPAIIKRIKQVLADFPTELEKQSAYREELMQEPETFAREVEAACEFVEPIERRQAVAVLQDVANEKNLLAFSAMLHTMPHFKLQFIVDDELEEHRGEGGVRIAFYDRSGGQDYVRIDSTPIVSLEDAAFLYREGRINKFIVYEPSEEEKQFLRKAIIQIGIRGKDILSLLPPPISKE